MHELIAVVVVVVLKLAILPIVVRHTTRGVGYTSAAIQSLWLLVIHAKFM